MNHIGQALQERLVRLLYRHTKDEDMELTDAEFVSALLHRYRQYLDAPLVGPNE